MTSYTKNINRIEFEMTLACTGRCKHCSEGEHPSCTPHIDGDIGAELVDKISSAFKIKSLMTFGGEPLLYPEDVIKIQQAGRDAGIPERSIITNGFFSKDEERIDAVAKMISGSGVTKLLLSVDAFHQESIPLEFAESFAISLLKYNVFTQCHPAWLVSKEDDNPYNCETRKILERISCLGIEQSDGNIIFPSGNAVKYLSEYFDESKIYTNPYEEDPKDIHTVSISANGDILGNNIYKKDILSIIRDYKPYEK